MVIQYTDQFLYTIPTSTDYKYVKTARYNLKSSVPSVWF